MIMLENDIYMYSFALWFKFDDREITVDLLLGIIVDPILKYIL